jgi:hypothetical protein
MGLSIQELLELQTYVDNTAIHFLKDKFVVASIYRNIEKLTIKAQLGDDQNVTDFDFTYHGPIAVVYCSQITLIELEERNTHLGVMAIMSAVTFADVFNWIGMTNVHIEPTTVRQFDVGNPELYELAKALICHHTGLEWDEDFLRKKYHGSVDDFLRNR